MFFSRCRFRRCWWWFIKGKGKIFEWAKNLNKVDVNLLRIKDDLRIKYKEKENKSEYSTN